MHVWIKISGIHQTPKHGSFPPLPPHGGEDNNDGIAFF
jgi:hypothetical protein